MAYSKAELFQLIDKFETAITRKAASEESTVKLRSAERDLLSVMEAVRNLCDKALMGDKSLLAAVFGGESEALHRIICGMEQVTFSEMHADDQRWKGCLEKLHSTLAVLEDLGSFRPRKFGMAPPDSLRYGGNVATCYSPGERITLLPLMDGPAASFFSCEQELPEGLRLNRKTGVISGVLSLGVEVVEKTYVIIAGNRFGTTTASLTFEVKLHPPSSIEYAGIGFLPLVGETAEYVPVITGGLPERWCVEPDLADGCNLDFSSGNLRISPMDALNPTDYVISASNNSGTATVTVRIGAKLPAPISLSYPTSQVEYPLMSVLYLVPALELAQSRRAIRVNANVICGMTYSVSPALPDGLELAPQGGSISGTPTKALAKTTYRIVAKNAEGVVSVELPIQIRNVPPSGLHYKHADSYACGEPMSLSPIVRGIVLEWKVDSALPGGLSFDDKMGMIAGTPTEETRCSVRVTARNEAGESATDLLFVVKLPPPSNLSYPNAEELYALYRVMTLHPRINGNVDLFTITPALPKGLKFEAATGTICGTPTTTMESTTYEVIASNKAGAIKIKLCFGVLMMPPADLKYPQIDDAYECGEDLRLEPNVEGGARRWTVEPSLPSGITLDIVTGIIYGAPTTAAELTAYVVAASNEAGGTSAIISFKVVAAAPRGLSYPTARREYCVSSFVFITPELLSGSCGRFSVAPDLPAGVEIDPKTGVISGMPTAVKESTTYTVTIENIAGSASADLCFCICEIPIKFDFEHEFAAAVERTFDIEELIRLDPSKKRTAGNWMVWMVHRAWLNDPELTVFDFENLQMPLPHVEPRIAPKLMTALAHNTHILELHLNNSNLRKPQGLELAHSLRSNRTLKVLDCENNYLDCNAIETIAVAVKESPDCVLQQWRFDQQKTIGQRLGERVEESLASMLEENKSLVKLGVSISDPHWRRCIDTCLMRNTDEFRRARKRAQGRKTRISCVQVEPTEQTLLKIVLKGTPDSLALEVFDYEDEKTGLVRDLVAASRRLPTKEQLQAFANGAGKSLKFAEVALFLKEFNDKLFDAFLEGEVTLVDTQQRSTNGTLAAWSELNEKWTLDVYRDDKRRFLFRSDKTPAIELAETVVAWIVRPQRSLSQWSDTPLRCSQHVSLRKSQYAALPITQVGA